MAEQQPFYVIWSGALNLGDTPGVFMDAAFVGLLLQIPIRLTYVPPTLESVEFKLVTTEVEVLNGQRHPVCWDWQPGTPLPTPIGHIDDVDRTPGKRELHPLCVPRALATEGLHTMTVQCHPDVAGGLRDDFVLKRILAHPQIGARVGWS